MLAKLILPVALTALACASTPAPPLATPAPATAPASAPASAPAVVTDGDNDGFADDVDRCPYQPEPYPRCPASGGCPDDCRPPTLLQPEEPLKLNPVICFAAGKATVPVTALPIIDEVARVLREHPEIALVAVDGYTDDRRSERGLATRRAAAVREALVVRGVEGIRLRPRAGSAPGEPTAGKTGQALEAARAHNRRVAFEILDRK